MERLYRRKMFQRNVPQEKGMGTVLDPTLEHIGNIQKLDVVSVQFLSNL